MANHALAHRRAGSECLLMSEKTVTFCAFIKFSGIRFRKIKHIKVHQVKRHLIGFQQVFTSKAGISDTLLRPAGLEPPVS